MKWQCLVNCQVRSFSLVHYFGVEKFIKMPNEMITLQLGQCGNQSSSVYSSIFQFEFDLMWICSLICSWFRVLEALVLGAWHFSEWNAWEFCNRCRFGSKGCVLLSGWWRSLYSTISVVGPWTACHSLNYELSICESKWYINAWCTGYRSLSLDIPKFAEHLRECESLFR